MSNNTLMLVVISQILQGFLIMLCQLRISWLRERLTELETSLFLRRSYEEMYGQLLAKAQDDIAILLQHQHPVLETTYIPPLPPQPFHGARPRKMKRGEE